jgi:hypothetical protein
MTPHQARLYIFVAILGLLPLVAALYFLVHGLIEAVGMRAGTFRMALYLFILSVACTELRIYLGGRSSRDAFLVTHITSAILLTIMLIAVGFLFDSVWVSLFILILFLTVLFSGVPLWYRGMRTARVALRTKEPGSVSSQ